MAKSENEMRTRILIHMNKDHADSVIRYAEHYAHTSSFAARNATLTDITTTALTLRAGGRTHAIPLDPPLASLTEARVRLVAMDRAAAAALRRSPVTVTRYLPPRGLHAVVFAACVFGYVALARDAHLAPGGWPYELVLRHLGEAVVGVVRRYRALGFALMIGIHVVEAVVMARTRLARHTVPTGSGLWWAWVLSTFVEGFGSFQRLDAHVKRRERELAAKKH